jgi:D-sedoheptulose 7-phosphate isomerase
MGKCTLLREDFDNDKKKRLRILSLTDNTPYILAWGNDEGFDRVFVEQLKNLASPGDLLIAISGSGNSPNIIKAVEWANRNGLKTFGCTGYSGGKLRALAHQSLHVPLDDMGIVESIHLTAFHWVVGNLHKRISL